MSAAHQVTPPGWTTHAFKHAVSRGRAGAVETKGSVSNESGEGLYPAYSASGQDVWVEEPQFHGNGLVLSAVGARCGKVFRAAGRWSVVANTSVFLPRQGFDPDYLWYVTNREDFWLKGGAAQPYVLVPDSLAQLWTFPSPTVQRAIADFLDRKTAAIDALIAKKERLIELLEEKRQALITQAVTRGLDPNVPLKDSGIAWLGPIPAHWEVRRLRHVRSQPLQYGVNASAEDDDPSHPRFIRITDIRDDGTLRDDTFKSLPLAVAREHLLLDGDLLLARSGATVGKSFIYRKELGHACFAGYLIRLRVSATTSNPAFVKLWTESRVYWEQILMTRIQSTIENVSAQRYDEFVVVLPPVGEQDTIAEHTSNRLTPISTGMERLQASLERLREYRQALITAAVTGQLDVTAESP